MSDLDAALFRVVVWALVWATYGLIRNECIFRFRTKLIDEDYEAYHLLPSFDTMMWERWWVWPLSRFLPKT